MRELEDSQVSEDIEYRKFFDDVPEDSCDELRLK